MGVIMDEAYTVFETTWGWMGVVQGRRGIKRIVLPLPQRDLVIASIEQEHPRARPGHTRLNKITERLKAYFRGNPLSLSTDLDVRGHSPFCVAVWKSAQTIPWGTPKTYQWLSNQINPGRKSQRAVGGALGRNPFPLIVPCHRVVRSDRALGGFSAPGGISVKRKLLELEGVKFDQEGRVILV